MGWRPFPYLRKMTKGMNILLSQVILCTEPWVTGTSPSDVILWELSTYKKIENHAVMTHFSRKQAPNKQSMNVCGRNPAVSPHINLSWQQTTPVRIAVCVSACLVYPALKQSAAVSPTFLRSSVSNTVRKLPLWVERLLTSLERLRCSSQLFKRYHTVRCDLHVNWCAVVV